MRAATGFLANVAGKLRRYTRNVTRRTADLVKELRPLPSYAEQGPATPELLGNTCRRAATNTNEPNDWF